VTLYEYRERLRNYARVAPGSKEADKDEFFSSGKICALGLLIIGVIGFAIYAAFVIAGI